MDQNNWQPDTELSDEERNVAEGLQITSVPLYAEEEVEAPGSPDYEDFGPVEAEYDMLRRLEQREAARKAREQAERERREQIEREAQQLAARVQAMIEDPNMAPDIRPITERAERYTRWLRTPDGMQRYLKIASGHIGIGGVNTLCIIGEMPDATDLRSREKWLAAGCKVLPEEERHGIILRRMVLGGPRLRYRAEEVYDWSQVEPVRGRKYPRTEREPYRSAMQILYYLNCDDLAAEAAKGCIGQDDAAVAAIASAVMKNVPPADSQHQLGVPWWVLTVAAATFEVCHHLRLDMSGPEAQGIIWPLSDPAYLTLIDDPAGTRKWAENVDKGARRTMDVIKLEGKNRPQARTPKKKKARSEKRRARER
ncbi:MAG: hypothetical protein HDQ87_06390 [Clostridia bacterium]|nr:hypothetical protein [Clostridia bacterium]